MSAPTRSSVPAIGLIVAGLLAIIVGILAGGSTGGWIGLAGAIAILAGAEQAWKERRR